MINKFQIDWQIARLRARKEKGVEGKLQVVTSFLSDFPSLENYDRVMNWLKMTRVAYKDSLQRSKFSRVIQELQEREYNTADYGNNFGTYSLKELDELLRDLEKRKYSFQFKGNAPKDHIEFIEELKKEILRRKIYRIEGKPLANPPNLHL